jgi:tRNA(fMet)-specific endonuclease VapC
MATFLLDTNAVSELGNPNPNRGVLSRFHLHEFSCALAAPTVEELAFGIARLPASHRRRTLEVWFEKIWDNFDLIPYNADCAIWLGRERARLSGLGQTAPAFDSQIAAIAVCNDLTLVTRNTADFAHFRELRVENWFAS